MHCSDWILIAVRFIVVIYAEKSRQFSVGRAERWTGSSSRMTGCTSDLECDVTLGYSCYWLFDGCHVGQCMCDPRKHRRLPTGRCVTVKFGDERCSANDVCTEGMTCNDGICQCHAGVMTPDGQHCLRSHHRLLGQRCDVKLDVCYQKSANGYTKNGIFCSGVSVCECQEGSRANGLTCRSLRIHERGCSKFYHCEGGAVCVDTRCICPNGYTSSAHGTRCVKRDAITDLSFGGECDEINERRYCSIGLVCHRCPDEGAIYRCVRFSMPSIAGFLSSESPSIRPSVIVLVLNFVAWSALIVTTYSHSATWR